MLCMVLLKASQRHNSDLGCATGWDKLKDFTLISDENSGHFPPPVSLHTVCLLAALLQQGLGQGWWRGLQPGAAASAPGPLNSQGSAHIHRHHPTPGTKGLQTQTKCLCCSDCNHTEEQYHKNWDTEFLLNM